MTKPTKWLCAQRRLRSAWASAQSDQSSLSLWRTIRSSATYWVHSEDTDQTGRMPRLIWVFAGHIVILFVLSWGSSHTLFKCRICMQSLIYKISFIFAILIKCRICMQILLNKISFIFAIKLSVYKTFCLLKPKNVHQRVCIVRTCTYAVWIQTIWIHLLKPEDQRSCNAHLRPWSLSLSIFQALFDVSVRKNQRSSNG